MWIKKQYRGYIEYSMENKNWRIRWDKAKGEGTVLYRSGKKQIADNFNYKEGNFAEGVGIPKYVIDLVEMLIIDYRSKTLF